MHLKTEIAAALRAIRQLREMNYDQLNDATFRSTLSLLERGKTGVTVGKLSELTAALDFDLIAFVALCVALERGQSPDDALASAKDALGTFAAAGGLDLLQKQLNGATLVQRAPGKPAKRQNISAVKQLRSQGKTQAEVVRLLGLPQSTVQRYWHASAKADEE